MSPPLSCADAALLIADSARSPTCPVIPSRVPAATATAAPHEGSSHARSTIAASTEATICAAAPSRVLRGLTTGASLWWPIVEPTR
jgi:hypothetical protein